MGSPKDTYRDPPIFGIKGQSHHIRVETTQETREELHDVRLGTWSCSIRPENLETLPLRNKVHRVHRPSESQTYPQPEDAQHETEKIEAMKEENLEEEALSCANQKLKTGADGINYLNGRAWIPKVNDLSKTSECIRIVAVTNDSSVEMGKDHDGFCDKVT
ncbi:hypothetical protein Tco_0951959 [Tanacetum coccineum]|uniref:Uncharacterized protein n=1 Tax=Tanacetum coccineum TaxID=301880 RepID=A0ABQ5E1N9_9ASTR